MINDARQTGESSDADPMDKKVNVGLKLVWDYPPSLTAARHWQQAGAVQQ
jgi:hypothetical protein